MRRRRSEPGSHQARLHARSPLGNRPNLLADVMLIKGLPILDHAAVPQPVHDRAEHGDQPRRRILAEQGAEVGAAFGEPDRYPVSLREHVLDRDPEVRHSSPEPGGAAFELGEREAVGVVVMDVVRVETGVQTVPVRRVVDIERLLDDQLVRVGNRSSLVASTVSGRRRR